MTVEGERDDISGIGQTRVTHALTPNLAEDKHQHLEQAGVGHYGLFNGARFRNQIAPQIKELHRQAQLNAGRPSLTLGEGQKTPTKAVQRRR